MKHIKLKCCVCGKTTTIHGNNADEVIKKIDKSGWHDRPAPYGDICPDCEDNTEEDE